MILNVPNTLSFLRLLLIPFFLFASFRGMFTTAFVLFITAAVTDIFDGLIARRLNQKSRVGAILDPAADKIMLVFGYLYYTLAQNLPVVRIPGWLTFTVFIRDFLIMLFAYLLYTRGVKRFPPSWAGKISTLLQATTLGAVIAANAFAPRLYLLSQVLFRLTLLMTLFSAAGYLRRGKRMLLESSAAA